MYYNDDANLGGSINKAVDRSQAVRGWADGLEALGQICNEDASKLMSLEKLDLSGLEISRTAIDGIGMLLGLGRLQILKLKGAKGSGAAGAKRLAVELAAVDLDLHLGGHLDDQRAAALEDPRLRGALDGGVHLQATGQLLTLLGVQRRGHARLD